MDALESRLLLSAQVATTFQTPLAIPELGPSGEVIAKGDFNGDGYLDLAATGGTSTPISTPNGQSTIFDGGVQILLNDRTGQFTPAGQLRKIQGQPTAIAVGDLNGDGNADVVVAEGLGGFAKDGSTYTKAFVAYVDVFLGDGRGGLGEGSRYAANDLTLSLALGDFNGDGRTDIAAGGLRMVSINPNTQVITDESQISVLRNAGGGAFFAADETHIAGTSDLKVTPIDYDNDGRTDLAATGNGQVQFLQSKGDGTFDFPDAWAGAGIVTTADVNRDGRADLIGTFASGGVVRYALGRSKGGFGELVTVAGTGGGRLGLLVGDFNGDGRVDFVNGDGPQVTGGVFLQQSNGSFAEVSSNGIGLPSLAGDFNNDGRDDAASVGQIFLATPPAVFTTPKRTLVIEGTRRADTVSLTLSGSRISITLNGETVTARLSRVRRIQITTGLGRDTITLDPSIFSPTLISSGGDSDTVTAGSGDDTLQGDNGSDVLVGGAGIDLIQGGKGLDTLDGGAGVDAIYGGRDIDTFSSNDALDELLDRSVDEPIV